MKATELFTFINKILNDEEKEDCRITFDTIMSPKHPHDNIDIINIEVNGKHLQYTTDFKEITR